MKFNHKKYSFVFDSDEYRTPDSKFKKSFLPASLKFYSKFAFIVSYCNLKTKLKIYDRYNWAASSIHILRSLESVGVKLHITGLNNLRKCEEPVIFVANHMSTLETVILPAIIQPLMRVCFVMKKELTTYPLFGPVSKARHPIIVGRSNPRDDLRIVLEEGARRLESGISIIIFPQRTRSNSIDFKKFNTLGVKLAQKNKVKVIPIAILSDAWSNGKLIKEFGPIDTNKEVRFSFGEPIATDTSSSEAQSKTIEFIKNSFISWDKQSYIM
ncbi:MAG: lysophospholipid acyltransferase family protein [Ignavibacteria bacterium]|jgi:1-acyl-sn-glycerol-3-phosphate acyltransferase